MGAGPGDLGLLTLRGAASLRRAEVVVVGPGVPQEIVAEHAPGAEVIGSELEEDPAGSLIRLAARERAVAWLVRGDPFLSPAVSEAAAALRAAGVMLEVVPGIAPALAAATHAGLPLVELPSGGAVVLRIGSVDGELGLRGSGGAAATELSEVAVEDLERLTRSLLDAGRTASEPAALVVRGGTPRQRTVVDTLASIAAAAAGLEPGESVTLAVGAAARSGPRLRWLEERPLFGVRIAVTRPRAQAGPLVATLEELGAEVIRFPTIRIQPPADRDPLLDSARHVASFDWVVFTSANGVTHFRAALDDVGLDARALAGVSICAIGPATAAALEAVGLRADLLPERFVAESVVEALTAANPTLSGVRLLLPRADLARALLPIELRARGAEVVEVVAYRTVPDTSEADQLRRRIGSGDIDLVTFTSSSTVENFVALVGADLGGAGVASIGPVTSATARRLGLEVQVEAEEYTVPGLVRAIIQRYQGS